MNQTPTCNTTDHQMYGNCQWGTPDNEYCGDGLVPLECCPGYIRDANNNCVLGSPSVTQSTTSSPTQSTTSIPIPVPPSNLTPDQIKNYLENNKFLTLNDFLGDYENLLRIYAPILNVNRINQLITQYNGTKTLNQSTNILLQTIKNNPESLNNWVNNISTCNCSPYWAFNYLLRFSFATSALYYKKTNNKDLFQLSSFIFARIIDGSILRDTGNTLNYDKNLLDTENRLVIYLRNQYNQFSSPTYSIEKPIVFNNNSETCNDCDNDDDTLCMMSGNGLVTADLFKNNKERFQTESQINCDNSSTLCYYNPSNYPYNMPCRYLDKYINYIQHCIAYMCLTLDNKNTTAIHSEMIKLYNTDLYLIRLRFLVDMTNPYLFGNNFHGMPFPYT
jgi:hypothetical protein